VTFTNGARVIGVKFTKRMNMYVNLLEKQSELGTRKFSCRYAEIFCQKGRRA